ncbi:MAG: phosphatidate cytidylyltransferase [Clostridia bacterium]|nr:phosphatidate cytidylyltransferase [Clostridia bacterium]
MKQRVITGALFAIIFIGAMILMNTLVFPVFIAVLSAIAVGEIEKAVGVKNRLIMASSITLAAIIPFLFHFRISIPFAVAGGIYVVAILIMMLLQFEKTRFIDAVIAIFASVCVPYAFSVMIIFRDIEFYIKGYKQIDGIYLLIFAFFASWMTDIFAYFVGSKFGKHKLCPKISPKKSVEGAIGGIAGAVLLNVLLLVVFQKVFGGGAGFNYVVVIVLSIILSVVSMFGDLAASTIKRNFGIKDFGKLLPGHGGIMDRFDSALFVMPVLYSAIYIVSKF